MTETDHKPVSGKIELISIHIPKTGGRSFLEVLKQVYGNALDIRHEREHFFPNGRFSQINDEIFPDHIRGIHAHLSVSQLMPVIEKHDPRIITWLRDPVERVISNYYFFMKRLRTGNANERQLRKKNYTLLEYAKEGKKNNRMDAFLEGMELHDFFFIGILERFEADMEELITKMGWPRAKSFSHVNSNAGFKHNNDCKTQYSDIDDEMRHELAMLNDLDIKLYNDVKKMRGIE